jgi:hypothetical protein
MSGTHFPGETCGGVICPPCACTGDIVGTAGACPPDGFIDSNDINYVKACACSGANPCGIDCDVNCDGTVDWLDVSVLRCQFEGACFDCVLPTTGACCNVDSDFNGVVDCGCQPSTSSACLAAGTFFSGESCATVACCQTDVASGSCTPDGFSDLNDSLAVVDCVKGTSACDCGPMDIDGDGDVDLLDAALPVCAFGGTCGPGNCILSDPIGACDVSGLGFPESCYFTTEITCVNVNLAGGSYLGEGTCCSAAECDDGNPCTTEVCVAGACGFLPTCNETSFCDPEFCDFGAGGACIAGPEPCTTPELPDCDETADVCFNGATTSDCCTAEHGSGCTGAPGVETCVCASDPYCCSDDWDEQCVAEVEVLGCGACEDVAVNFDGLDCNNNNIVDHCEVDCGAGGGRCGSVVGCGTGTDADTNGVLDVCEETTTDIDLDIGETSTLNPGGGSNDPITDALVEITNTGGGDDASISVSETTQNLHPGGTGGFSILGTTLSIETSLADGEFFMTLSVPFGAADLNSVDPQTLDLSWYDEGTGDWVLAVAGNTEPSPGHEPDVIGDRFAECNDGNTNAADGCNTSSPLLSSDLGDYGVFWDAVTETGFVWANVDHASDFAPGGALVASCTASAADCADLDSDGARDDNCVWWECATDSCADTPLTQFADMGGAFGACPPDTFANIHDKNHALSCFAGTNPCDPINIDAGGAYGACPPDGFCNIHDANHVLSAFAGTSTCSCPSGPLPVFDPPVDGAATLVANATKQAVSPGSSVQVHVFIEGPVDALRSYQLDTTATGGKTGAIDLVDITVEERMDAAFYGTEATFEAFNTSTGQMLHGLETNDGVAVKEEAYLATFTFEVSKDASGKFVIDLLIGDDGQTFLISPDNGQIEIKGTTPAVITVSGSSVRR